METNKEFHPMSEGGQQMRAKGRVAELRAGVAV